VGIKLKNKNKMNDKRVYVKLVIAYGVFLIASVIFINKEITELSTTLLSIVAFLFGIFLAFSITNRQHRLNSIRRLLRVGDGLIADSYQLTKVFPKKVTEQGRRILDKYLIKQIDYTLNDYEKSNKEIMSLYNFVLQLKPRTDLQKESQKKMIDNVRTILQHRKRIIYNIHNKMFVFEWIALIGLYVVFIILMFQLNDGSGLAVLILPILATVLTLLLWILQNLNNLRWQESLWIWKQISELFVQLKLKPYFVEDIISTGRFPKKEVKKLREYRLAVFPNKYPDMSGKKVKVIKNRK
jgi:hypothetical protein